VNDAQTVRLAFSRETVEVSASHVVAFVTAAAVQPSHHARTLSDAGSFARERDEHRLSRILREMRIAEPPKVNGVDKTDPTLDQLPEASVVSRRSKLAE
jgi:hypothetical protein